MESRFSLVIRRGKTVFCGLIALCVSSVIIFGSLCFAVEVSTFTGAEYDGRGQGFSYLAIDVTQNINKTIAISGRVMPNYLTYEYYSGDTLIRAKSPGVYALAGVKLFWNQTMFGVYSGIEARDTDLSPDDRSSNVRGHTTAGMVQGEFSTMITKKTNINIAGSYSGISNFSYERASIKQQISNFDYTSPFTFHVGAEQFFGQNSDYRGEGYGAFLEMFYIPQKISVAVRGGFKHDSTFGNGGYWGLQIYKGF